MPLERPTAAPHRLASVLGRTATALRALRGATVPYALVGVTAERWRELLGPKERAFMLIVAAEASEQVDAEYLRFVLGGPPPFSEDTSNLEKMGFPLMGGRPLFGDAK